MRTANWLLSGVDGHMSLQSACYRERLLTNGATVHLLTRVSSKMNFKRVSSVKRLGTKVTLIELLPTMHNNMILEIVFLREFFWTLITAVRFLFSRCASYPESLSGLFSSVAYPGCLSRIPDPDFYPSRIPDPGSKNSNKREG
jgi:hypothetical protein